MAITFSLDAAKLNKGTDVQKGVACDLQVDLFRRSAPTAPPLPGAVRPWVPVHSSVASAPPATPAPRLGLAPLLASPLLAPMPAVPAGTAAPTRVGAPCVSEECSADAKADAAAVPPSARFSAFAGVVSAALFGVYATVRFVVVSDHARTEHALATAAAFATSLTFLASVAFHGTLNEARSLVDALVGLALVVTTLADIATATRGFEDVPVSALIDQPIAVAVATAFFLWRRARSDAPTAQHEHRDLEHQPTKETVALLVVASYFMIVPVFVATLGSAASAAVLALQVAASGLLLFAASRPAHGQCPGCGLSSHTVALLVATMGALAREVALSTY